MLKTNYLVKSVDYRIAMDMIVKNHYLHRKAPCSQAFGLFNQHGNVEGVVTYGTPASRSLQKGICGEEEANNVIELTRLWIQDGTPKNAESFLIGKSIPLVDKEIIVSYAEIDQGHLGIVYQASNFIYTGKSDKHNIWFVEGYDAKHSRHLFDLYGGINKAKKILGDKMVEGKRPRKHRYIYFNANRKRRVDLLNKLRYPIQSYPKNKE